MTFSAGFSRGAGVVNDIFKRKQDEYEFDQKLKQQDRALAESTRRWQITSDRADRAETRAMQAEEATKAANAFKFTIGLAETYAQNNGVPVSEAMNLPQFKSRLLALGNHPAFKNLLGEGKTLADYHVDPKSGLTAFEVDVEDEYGRRRAPVTRNRSSDPEDQVVALTGEQVADLFTGHLSQYSPDLGDWKRRQAQRQALVEGAVADLSSAGTASMPASTGKRQTTASRLADATVPPEAPPGVTPPPVPSAGVPVPGPKEKPAPTTKTGAALAKTGLKPELIPGAVATGVESAAASGIEAVGAVARAADETLASGIEGVVDNPSVIPGVSLARGAGAAVATAAKNVAGGIGKVADAVLTDDGEFTPPQTNRAATEAARVETINLKRKHELRKLEARYAKEAFPGAKQQVEKLRQQIAAADKRIKFLRGKAGEQKPAAPPAAEPAAPLAAEPAAPPAAEPKSFNNAAAQARPEETVKKALPPANVEELDAAAQEVGTKEPGRRNKGPSTKRLRQLAWLVTDGVITVKDFKQAVKNGGVLADPPETKMWVEDGAFVRWEEGKGISVSRYAPSGEQAKLDAKARADRTKSINAGYETVLKAIDRYTGTKGKATSLRLMRTLMENKQALASAGFDFSIAAFEADPVAAGIVAEALYTHRNEEPGTIASIFTSQPSLVSVMQRLTNTPRDGNKETEGTQRFAKVLAGAGLQGAEKLSTSQLRQAYSFMKENPGWDGHVSELPAMFGWDK